MATLAVHEDQRVVRRQVAQRRRPHDGGGVADRLRVDVERRNDRGQLVLQIDDALVGQIGGGQHVARHRRCRDWAREPTTTVSFVNPSSKTCSSSRERPRARMSSTGMRGQTAPTATRILGCCKF